MKTFLAALAAGLIGGGAVIGVVALNLVPMQPKTKPVNTEIGALELSDAPAVQTSTEHDALIRNLTEKVQSLEVQLAKKSTAVSREEYDSLKAELAKLKSTSPTVAKSEDVETAEGPVSEVAPSDPAFESAVRDVYARIEAERIEERRTERQAQRLEQLEQSKQRIAEFVPKLVESRAANLNIPETVVADVSAALVTHAQYRAEIQSEVDGQRIDGQEIDKEATQQKLDELDQTTVAALTTYVDEETATQLVSALSRTGRDNNAPRAGARRGNR